MRKITLTIDAEEYSAPVNLKPDVTLDKQLKTVTNAANEAYNDYCFAHKLGRYAE